jgi:DNA-binding MarR family transcriptional regulator
MDTGFLIVPLLRAFNWLEEGLQTRLREQGWSDVTRPQMMVMIALVMGVKRPSEIARVLGVSRQAVHTTIAGMVEIGLLELTPDPADRRSKLVVAGARGQRFCNEAEAASRAMRAELAQRIGETNLKGLREALDADWGPPITRFDPET